MPPAHAAIRAQALAEDAAAHFAVTPGKLWIPNAAPNNRGEPIYDSIQDAFPDVKHPYQPLGSIVMVMLKLPPLKLTGAFEVNDDDRHTERDNQQVGKVVAMGPLAFRRRETCEPWPEGAWCGIGDFVYVPKYQGDRTRIKHKRTYTEFDDRTGREVSKTVIDDLEFASFKDLAIIGRFDTLEEALACRGFL